jgi:hypothetical protein
MQLVELFIQPGENIAAGTRRTICSVSSVPIQGKMTASIQFVDLPQGKSNAPVEITNAPLLPYIAQNNPIVQ